MLALHGEVERSAEGGWVVRYGILDDEGKVIRWVWHPPPYPHVVEKVKKKRKPKLDLSNVPDALF